MAVLDDTSTGAAKATVERMRLEAEGSGAAERRSAERTPFFGPAQIELDNGDVHSGFTRDLSTPGIGLLHPMAIEPGEITVHIPLQSGTLSQRTLILWCQDVGDGWYASGGRFVDAFAPR
jgi:hypothetical protein